MRPLTPLCVSIRGCVCACAQHAEAAGWVSMSTILVEQPQPPSHPVASVLAEATTTTSSPPPPPQDATPPSEVDMDAKNTTSPSPGMEEEANKVPQSPAPPLKEEPAVSSVSAASVSVGSAAKDDDVTMQDAASAEEVKKEEEEQEDSNGSADVARVVEPPREGTTRKAQLSHAQKRLVVQIQFVENARKRIQDESHPDMQTRLRKLEQERDELLQLAQLHEEYLQHTTAVIFAYECEEATSEFEMSCEKLRQDMLEEIHHEMEIINDQRKGAASSGVFLSVFECCYGSGDGDCVLDSRVSGLTNLISCAVLCV